MRKKNFARIVALLLALLLAAGAGFASAESLGNTILKPGLNNSSILDPQNLILALAAPSELTATESGTGITLNWSDNSLNESGFEIERKSEGDVFTLTAKTAANVTSYADNSLAAGTYTFRVRAFNNDQKSSYSNEVTLTKKDILTKPDLPIPGSVVISLVPEAPGKLAAEAISGKKVRLTWADKSLNETGFKIERKGPPNKYYTEIATVKANTTSYEDAGLSNNTTYSYRVRAYNTSGNSTYSNEATVLTPTDIVAKVIKKTIIYHIGQPEYLLNGIAHPMDAAPAIVNNYTFIPIRYIAEPLGAVLTWDAASQKASFELDGSTVVLQVGNNIAQVNGADTQISSNPDVVPLIMSDRLFVPLAFVAANLGCLVTWDGSIQEITLIYPKN